MIAKNSQMADTIYEIMADNVLVAGIEPVYKENLVEDLIEYLDNHGVQWDMVVSTWPNEAGGTIFCSWIEDGNLMTVSGDYYK